MEKVKNEIMYEQEKVGFSLFGGDKVHIIGERTVVKEDGTELEQYVYNIEGLEPQNGKPFVSLKPNIIVEDK